jgi:excisionase family DNA binding protein
MRRTLNETGDKIDGSLHRVTKVAAFLGLSRSKVYAMMDAGQLPFVKFGKSRRIRWSDVQKLIDDNTVSAS